MNSPAFAPKHELTENQMDELMPRNPMSELDATITASSSHKGYGPEAMMDGDSSTIWHTDWSKPAATYPHEFTMTFKNAVEVSGIRLLPRQDGLSNGMVKRIEIYTSPDGKSWGKPVATTALNSNHEWKQIDFKKPQMAKAIRIEALSPQHGDHPWASFAEVAPVVVEE